MNHDEYRAKNIRVIFQGYNLLTNWSTVENIVLSMNISGSRTKNKTESAYKLLSELGIDKETANRKILHLSGGKQQRIGIARTLSHHPDIIIADEPTGNLDGDTTKGIIYLFNLLFWQIKIVTKRKEPVHPFRFWFFA